MWRWRKDGGSSSFFESDDEPELKPAGSGAWSSGLCACFSDIRTCLAVTFCCFPCTFGQLYQRTTQQPGSCKAVGSSFIILYWFALTLSAAAAMSTYLGWNVLVRIYVLGASLFTLYFLYSLRRLIRRRDGITALEMPNALVCGSRRVADALVLLVCTPCALCQMMRHEGMEGRYSLCANDGIARVV